MDVKETITDKDGKQKTVKVQMPSVGRILEAVKQRGLFVGITRYQYLQYDVEEALILAARCLNPECQECLAICTFECSHPQ